MRLLTSLGVEVSIQKSFAEEGIAEFAKAYFVNGEDFKPLSPDLLIWSNLEGPAKVVAIAENLKQKTSYLFMTKAWIKSAFPRRQRLLATLLVLHGCGSVWGVEHG